MSNESSRKKKRFKGIEGFFRKIAFNLGNTPSQTEVKIISCVPIDVTDLQQRIITLEKQLEDAKRERRKSEELGDQEVHTALYSPNFSVYPNTYHDSEGSENDENDPSNESIQRHPKRKKSAVCFSFSPQRKGPSVSVPLRQATRCSFVPSESTDESTDNIKTSDFRRHRKDDERRSFVKRDTGKQQSVYYAHTAHSPFNTYDVTLEPPCEDNKKKKATNAVNIVSCIPIDVSELQERILDLERQLEDVRGGNGGGYRSSVGGAEGRGSYGGGGTGGGGGYEGRGSFGGARRTSSRTSGVGSVRTN